MTDRRDEDRGIPAGDEEKRLAETERRANELREAWRRRRKPEDPPRRPKRDRAAEDDEKGAR